MRFGRHERAYLELRALLGKMRRDLRKFGPLLNLGLAPQTTLFVSVRTVPAPN
jgi:hypothetical protein